MLVFLFGSSVLRGGYGASRGRIWCRVGGIGARSSAVWGAKLGSDGSPRRGRQVKGQSRGHRLARDPSGTPSNHSHLRCTKFGSPLFSVELEMGQAELAGDKVQHGDQIFAGTVAASFAFGGLEHAVEPFHEGVG